MGVIYNFFNTAIEREKAVVKSACKGNVEQVVRNVTQEIREDIVDEWFQGFNSQSTHDATLYETSVHETGSSNIDSITVICDTWADSGLFNPDSSTIGAWSARHHMNYDDAFILTYYIMSIGHIGLPPAGQATDWVNAHYHPGAGGLWPYTMSHGKWGTFESEVKSKL